MKYKIVTSDIFAINGTVLYRGDLYTLDDWNRLHSYNDQPAHIVTESSRIIKHWYQHGKHHRATGPAVIYQWLSNGTITHSWYYGGTAQSAFSILWHMYSNDIDISEYLFSAIHDEREAATKILKYDKGVKPLP